MATLEILEFPDPRLRSKAIPVEFVDDTIKRLVADMLETMYEAAGIGLAATQIDVHQRILVLDVSEERDQPHVFINPEITASRGGQVYEEGCLSVPGVYAEVERADWIEVNAINEHGAAIQTQADGLLAVCLQHEMDHLDGKLFVDYLSPLKRARVRKKLEKQRRAVL